MHLDVEVIQSERDYEGELLFVVAYRLGLVPNLHEGIVLVKAGAVIVNGRAVRDLNFRLPKGATIVVGLHGIVLGVERRH